MGGTSFDVGFVSDGQAAIEATPHIDAMPIATPTIQVHSIGLGGGSIAAVADGVLKVGPESAGSAPGPAAYGKGGASPRSPTPTSSSASSIRISSSAAA